MDTKTVDQALTRIMELHKASPSDSALSAELHKILSALRFAGWGEGYSDRYDDEAN